MSDARVMMEYDANKKSPVVAYLLWWFLGTFGAHRFYLSRTGSAVTMLVLMVVSTILTVIVIGFIGLAALGVWWLVDAFLIPGMSREYNLALGRVLAR
ncbi:MAG: TM2 domain-containing protein [Phycisphaerales bacterium]|nr:TM2 domain-containing protein [Phycisphaerales bacterium]